MDSEFLLQVEHLVGFLTIIFGSFFACWRFVNKTIKEQTKDMGHRMDIIELKFQSHRDLETEIKAKLDKLEQCIQDMRKEMMNAHSEIGSRMTALESFRKGE